MKMLHSTICKSQPVFSVRQNNVMYTIRFIAKPFSVIQYYFYPAFFYLIQQSIDISKVASPPKTGNEEIISAS